MVMEIPLYVTVTLPVAQPETIDQPSAWTGGLRIRLIVHGQFEVGWEQGLIALQIFQHIDADLLAEAGRSVPVQPIRLAAGPLEPPGEYVQIAQRPAWRKRAG